MPTSDNPQQQKPNSEPVIGPILLSFLLYLLLFFIIWGVFGDPLPVWGAILLYLACNFVVTRQQKGKEEKKETPKSLQNLPTSGPIGRAGPLALAERLNSTATLAILNPFQFVQQMQQLAGQALITRRLRRQLPSVEIYIQQARYHLPFSGKWLILNGGTTPQNSHSWEIITQRYAYDFVITGDEQQRHTGKGTRLEEYFCYGTPILAAADGEVVRVSDGVSTPPW
jgi:hypothetical protein